VYTPVPPVAWQVRDKNSAALIYGPTGMLAMNTLRLSAAVDNIIVTFLYEHQKLNLHTILSVMLVEAVKGVWSARE
jgi:hypothetical protein